jgi:hypothetical protein
MIYCLISSTDILDAQEPRISREKEYDQEKRETMNIY